MITDKFSWSRVGSLLQRYLIENKRNLGMVVGVLFGMMLFFGIVVNKNTVDFEERGIILWAIYFWISTIALQVTGSLTFSSMSTKPKRIVAMMLPASKLEKFVALFLIYIVGGNIAIIASGVVADALSSLVFGHGPSWANFGWIIKAVPQEKHFFEIVALFGFTGLALLLLSQSLFLIGSALWPKRSFLKTYLVLFFLQILVPIILPFGSMVNLLDWLVELDWSWDKVSGHTMVWSGVVFLYGVLYLFYWLAWRRFRSTQLIQKFMMN